MWDYDVYSRTQRRKKDAQKTKQKNKTRKQVHLRRAEAQIKAMGLNWAGAQPTVARVFAHDYRDGVLRIFSAQPFSKDQDVGITIHAGGRLFVQGRVLTSAHAPLTSRIMTAQVFPFRIAVRIHFSTFEERMRVERFLLSLGRPLDSSTANTFFGIA